MIKIITVTSAVCAVSLLLGSSEHAEAQGFDLTFFVGRAFPTYDERLTLRPSTPTVPGVDISVEGSPLIEADGGPVFGGALAYEFGVLGIEGRLDATDVGLAITGARYNLRGTRAAYRRPHGEHHGLRWDTRRGSHPAPVRERENPHARLGCLDCLRWPELSLQHHRNRVHSGAPGDTGRPLAPRLRPEADAPRSARSIGTPVGRERRRGPPHRRTRGADG